MERFSLVGVDGNAYAIMGYVSDAMRQCGHSKDERGEYFKRATSGDYDNLLAVSVAMCEKLNKERNL